MEAARAGFRYTSAYNPSRGKFTLMGDVIIGDEFELGGSIGVDWTLANKAVSLGVKYIHHNALTLVGERNTPNILGESHRAHEVAFTAFYNY